MDKIEHIKFEGFTIPQNQLENKLNEIIDVTNNIVEQQKLTKKLLLEIAKAINIEQSTITSIEKDLI